MIHELDLYLRRLAVASRVGWVGPLVLTAAEIDRVPEGIGGVYLLTSYWRERGTYPVFYAGMSDDLRRRLGEHVHESAKNRIAAVRACFPAYVCLAQIESPDVRSSVESFLIRLLRPICNDQIPSVPPTPVRLPPLTIRP